jgi:CRP-like cAMP-binding protein
MAQQQLACRIPESAPMLVGCDSCPAAALGVCTEVDPNDRAETQEKDVSQKVGFAPARRVFCRQDEVRDLVPVLCSGWAAAYVNLPNGDRQILSFILPGELVSASLIFSGAQNVWVEAISDVQYRTFNRADLVRMIIRHPESFTYISDVWTEEKRRGDRLVVDLGRRAAEERIASLLLDLMERLEARKLVQPDGSFEFPLRQHHIADATGLTSVHVSKVLMEFRRRGVFSLSDRVLIVYDEGALKRSAGDLHSR